jgi:hypothetical protein
MALQWAHCVAGARIVDDGDVSPGALRKVKVRCIGGMTHSHAVVVAQ